ncbi:MAG: aspartate aminotransferase family protein [SAR202 cluster bacterium Casp-Chloro-G4]|nr:aspartate aminotransferase family protein [Chloroflexota bacterium]MDA1227803.1 aspartate aminotransferase family protein [Chloroflexota bacterium]PKB61333.1 MAG: aspartate aminotransferase family protein [SAR202 cluster bacterium Casp-Chloro-G4]
MPERKISEQEKQIERRARKVLPGGSLGNLTNNIVITEGKAGRVRDASGNEYVDYLLGSGPMLVGHAHPEVIAAVQQQLEKGTTFFANNEHAVLLAEEIVSAVACAEKVRFTTSGTEATLFAMRAARAFRGRDKVLKFEGGYHGMHDYALMSMITTNPVDFPQATPDSAGIPKSIQNEMLIAPFNDLETTSAIIERHHDELAAVIVEPFQRLIPPKPGFLQGLRDVTNQYEIPLIFDEIVTGFRFAYGGAQEFYGVTPDLCTMGKVIAGGFPLALVAGKDEIMAHFDRSAEPDAFLPQIGTLSGNPVAAVAGLATLEILKRPGTYERLFATGQTLKDELQRLMDEAEIPAKVVGEAPLFDVFFTEEEITDYRSTLRADKTQLNRFNALLLEEGVLKGDSKFYISVAHDQDDVRRTLDAFQFAVNQLKV